MGKWVSWCKDWSVSIPACVSVVFDAKRWLVNSQLENSKGFFAPKRTGAQARVVAFQSTLAQISFK
jgi:hypothetical protein